MAQDEPLREDPVGLIGQALAMGADFPGPAEDLQEMRPDSVALVDDRGAPVATDQFGVMISGGRGH